MASNSKETRASRNKEQPRRTLMNMDFTIPHTGDAAKKSLKDHEYVRGSALDPFALRHDEMDTDLDAIDGEDLLNGMLEDDDNMEDSANPVPPYPFGSPVPLVKGRQVDFCVSWDIVWPNDPNHDS